MNTALNNLLFRIDLVDRVSAPIGRIMQTIDQAGNRFQSGFAKIGIGAAGLAGSVYTLNSLLEPTREMNRALGEVKSLDVANDGLEKLRKTSLGFSKQYGESAAQFVKSSYDLQSAIPGVADQLPEFTRASAILAKGTKADMDVITSYVGTTYNIFEKTANAMGKANWVNQLAGQTAMAVQIFKTTGKGMADAFESLGASASMHSIPMAEQIAVMGKLSATMSGSEAGTKYRAFLDNVGKAQKTLGLQFTDTQGRMLPVIAILDKISAKFGQLDTVAETDLLKKAFGTQEAAAFVQDLSLNLGQLRTDIATIGQQSGLDKAIQMADAMTDPMDRLNASIQAISISIGTKFMPTLAPAFEGINKALESVWAWTEANPALAKNLGQIAFSLIGVTAAASAFTLFSGLATVSTALWKLTLNLALTPLWQLGKALWTALPSIWAFTAAIFANPMTWWALGITAVVGAVAAAVIYWDQWTAKVSGWAQNFQIGLQAVIGHVVELGGRFLEMLGVFAVVDVALGAWERLKGWWASFKGWLASLNPFDAILAGFNRVISLANKLPGLNISPIATGSPPISTGPKVQSAGIMKQINNSIMNGQKTVSIRNLNVNHHGSKLSGAKLRDELIMAGG